MMTHSFEKGFHVLAPLVPFASQVRCAAIAITLCSHWSSQNLQFVNERWSSMLRPWDFKILIRRGSKAAVFLQIAHALIDEIKRGRLAPGTALPGSRELAESLDINRKTVIQAYAELEAQGWVTTEKTRGTFVSAHLPQRQGAAAWTDSRTAGFPAGRHRAQHSPDSAGKEHAGVRRWRAGHQ